MVERLRLSRTQERFIGITVNYDKCVAMDCTTYMFVDVLVSREAVHALECVRMFQKAGEKEETLNWG